MNDIYDGTDLHSSIDQQSTPEAVAEPIDEAESTPEPASPPASEEPVESPAVIRFKSCRWHETPTGGAPYCNNRDVLPFAGKNGFEPDAWCPDCSMFKVKRVVRKRPPTSDYDY